MDQFIIYPNDLCHDVISLFVRYDNTDISYTIKPISGTHLNGITTKFEFFPLHAAL